MKKRIPPFIVTSNIFLFFPMAAAIYAKEWFYFIFAVLMFIASAGFHYTFYYNKKSFSLSRFFLRKLKYSSQKFFQITDWTKMQFTIFTPNIIQKIHGNNYFETAYS